jgi:cell division protein FtsB
MDVGANLRILRGRRSAMAVVGPRFSKFLRALWLGTRVLLITSFALVSSVGLVRAWTARGTVDDRRAELHRQQERLVELQLKHDELKARLEAMRTDPNVRQQVIRHELGLLRDGERVFIFK